MMTLPDFPSLAPYEPVLQALLAPLSPVPPRLVALEAAEGRIAAGTRAQTPLPVADLARADGFAVAALDLVGASALSPVYLSAMPQRVTSGAAMPPGTDAVLPATLLERRGAMALALGEVLPGEGVLRRGEWLGETGWIAAPGQRIRAAELMLAEEAGLQALDCRIPRVLVIALSGRAGPSTRRVLQTLRQAGAEAQLQLGAADPAAQAGASDLILLIGGTGSGPDDRAAQVIAAQGSLMAHGIGYSAAPTLALGQIAGLPVIALPGAPEAAMAGVFALLAPVLARLTGRVTPPQVILPLKRKVASMVGQAELLLLAREDEGWLPLSPGLLSPEALRRAAGWRITASGEEGWAEGTPLAANLLEEGLPI